ncbi:MULTISPECIES: calcium-translocating P-type ATPase, SERCA-type [Prosthecochloris]|nr:MULTISPECIES: calcium-translocating P-type ATPase, SERCA-type [Prosthecochloris]ANT63973.1 Calcium-transporting ATPase [Prosthecochloris sp. CIB 2401]
MQSAMHTAASAIMDELGTSADGLRSAEARARLERYGPNQLQEAEGFSAWKILLQQFRSVLVWLLLFAVAVSLVLGDLLESSIITVILVLNSLIGFFQEYRAEKALGALRKLSSLQARVVRDGRPGKVAAQQLVPGDVIILEPGDRIPADARVFEAMNFETEEAMLTGESLPVAKTVDPVSADAPLAERYCMVYSGTLVARGRASAVVTATGMQTELGRIAGLLGKDTDEYRSPLQAKLNRFSRNMAFAVGGAALVMFIVSLLAGGDLLQTFRTSISLAVAAIPEGLPAIVALTLARGVQRMVKNNAIVRHLPSIETLGSSSVICSDKTGTMTMNRMSVREDFLPAGYAEETRALLYAIGALCNDARRQPDREVIGDPTEAALLKSAIAYGHDLAALRERYPRVDEIGFDSSRKMMSTLHRAPGGSLVMYVKGAPDVLVARCTRVMTKEGPVPLDEERRDELLQQNEVFAEHALRVLGFAWKPVTEGEGLREEDLVFVGLQAMNDPPRPEVVDAVARCREAGITVVMITGDQKPTAQAIGKELGIGGQAMSGKELDAVEDLAPILEEVSIFARVSPEQKIRIVEAFQQEGHVVAMTGDGVNDAPALRQADIGVAMGKGGTDVAREASTMVLTDDNFASIVKAIEEGRVIFQNLRKFVFFLLSSNISEVLIILIGILVGLPLPLVAIQILWVNLITDGLPALALGLDPRSPDTMKRPPIEKSAAIVNRHMLFRLIVASGVITMGSLGLYIYELTSSGDYLYASTMAFTSLVVFEMFNAFLARSETRNIFTLGITTNPWMLGAIAVSLCLHVLVLYSPFQEAFHVKPLSLQDWAVVVAVSSLLPMADMLFKQFVKPTHYAAAGGSG